LPHNRFSQQTKIRFDGNGVLMGVEGKDRARDLASGAQVLSGHMGKTIQRLRKAYNLSLSELAEQSGVAKSIISQIERNETNPTLATIWRLSQALDVSIERVLATSDEEPFIERSSKADTPILVSDDGKMRLAIVGWIKTIEWLQWYDVRSEPGGELDSDGHQRGSVECLSVLDGEFEVQIGETVERAKAGETLRYRCDRRHIVRCVGTEPGRASMVCILKAAVMD
jgi:transcriptional regulator with XRE-family HTH domain